MTCSVEILKEQVIKTQKQKACLHNPENNLEKTLKQKPQRKNEMLHNALRVHTYGTFLIN